MRCLRAARGRVQGLAESSQNVGSWHRLSLFFRFLSLSILVISLVLLPPAFGTRRTLLPGTELKHAAWESSWRVSRLLTGGKYRSEEHTSELQSLRHLV